MPRVRMSAPPPLPPSPPVRSLLERLSGREVWWCPNPGNAGDALIASATRDLFRRFGVRAHTLRPDQLAPAGAVALYGGGGGLTPDYPDAARFLAAHARRAGELVLLPHSVRGHADLLAALDRRTLLLCRTADSLAWARAQAPLARVEPADDLALHLDARAFLEAGRRRARWVGLLRKRIWRLRLRSRRFRPDADGVLRNFRADCESTGRNGGQVLDLSNALAVRVRREPHCFLATWLLLSVLDRAREVHTDRLHVGIGAALLGKQVVFHDDAHGKLRGVHQASMAGWAHVRMAD